MRYLILLLIILTTFLATSNTMAANKPKPPKNVCYLMDGDGVLLGRVLGLTFKSNGMKFADIDNKVKLYSVSGGIFTSVFTPNASPITGSANYNEENEWYKAIITGHESGSVTCSVWIKDSGEDDAYCTVLPDGGIKPANAIYDLTEYDCRLLDFDGSNQ